MRSAPIRPIVGNCTQSCLEATSKSGITGFVFRNWSGARDLNPGPNGPELLDISSRKRGNDRFQLETSAAASRTVQICSAVPLDYYMKYYMAGGSAGNDSATATSFQLCVHMSA